MSNVPNTNRVLLGRAAAYESWSRTTDRTARTANARKAFNDGFEQQADPDGRLSPEERARRGALLRKAWFARLAAKSVAARKARSLKSRVPVDGEQR